MRETIGGVFLGLAVLVVLYNFSLWVLSRRDGQFRSFVTLVPTILAVLGVAAGARHWRLLLAIVALDLGLPMLRRRWPEEWSTASSARGRLTSRSLLKRSQHSASR